MTERRTVEDFGLLRKEGYLFGSHSSTTTGSTSSSSSSDSDADREAAEKNRLLNQLRFMVPLAGPFTADDWQFFRIIDPNIPRFQQLRRTLVSYAVNSTTKALVVFSAYLQEVNRTERFTEMRLWEMLADCWAASGNAADELRFVGYPIIVNNAILAAIEEERTYQEAQAAGQREWRVGRQRTLTVTQANATNWADNIFIRSGVRLAARLSTPDRVVTCEKAHLFRERWNQGMVLEFKNGDAGQENYRERLIAAAEPMILHNILQKRTLQAAGRDWEGVVCTSAQFQVTP